VAETSIREADFEEFELPPYHVDLIWKKKKEYLIENTREQEK